MKNNQKFEVVDGNNAVPDFFSLFKDLPEIDPFDEQKESVAVDLAALISYYGFTRSKFIEKSGWKQSRLSNVLSGRCNLTIKTISEVADVLGCKFDVIYRSKDQKKARQVWDPLEKKLEAPHILPHFSLRIQSPAEVYRDLHSGKAAKVYVSLPDTEADNCKLNRYFVPELEDGRSNGNRIISMDLKNTIPTQVINKKVAS